MTIKNILDRKGYDVLTIYPNETIRSLVHLLEKNKIGAVVVSSDGQNVAGIVSERDVVHGIDEHGADLLDMPVTKVMTHDVVTCQPEDTVNEIMGVMTKHRIRHLPVIQAGTMVGVVSIGDVVKSRMDEMALEADALKSYIAG